MKKTPINPWTWQEPYHFTQAWRVDDAKAVIVLSGQGAASPEGELVGVGDFEAQVRQTFDNIKTVLEAGGASLDNVVKLNVYLTDMSNLGLYGKVKAEYFGAPYPAGTAIGVASLGLPGMLVEIEATVAI